MIICNGKIYSQLGDLPLGVPSFSQLASQFSIPIYSKKGIPLVWEETYFHLMSCLRRWRMKIPMEFTPDYLLDQIQLLQSQEEGSSLFVLSLLRATASNSEDPLTSFSWVLEGMGDYTPTNSAAVCEIELYKDLYLSEDYYATLPSSQQTQRDLAQIYAYENGYDDCLLLNTSKNIVESSQGALFLFSENTVVTPDLASGCQASVMRAAYIKWLKENQQYSFEERPLSPFELQRAEALLFVNPIRGIQSVSKYRKKTYSSPVLEELFLSFWEDLR